MAPAVHVGALVLSALARVPWQRAQTPLGHARRVSGTDAPKEETCASSVSLADAVRPTRKERNRGTSVIFTQHVSANSAFWCGDCQGVPREAHRMMSSFSSRSAPCSCTFITKYKIAPKSARIVSNRVDTRGKLVCVKVDTGSARGSSGYDCEFGVSGGNHHVPLI